MKGQIEVAAISAIIGFVVLISLLTTCWQLNEKLTNENKNLTNRIGDLEDKITELNRNITALKNENSILKDTIKNCNDTITNLTNNLTNCTSEYIKIKNMLELTKINNELMIYTSRAFWIFPFLVAFELGIFGFEVDKKTGWAKIIGIMMLNALFSLGISYITFLLGWGI